MHSFAVNDSTGQLMIYMLHLSAADIVKHCQSELTVESVTLPAVLSFTRLFTETLILGTITVNFNKY